MVYTMAADLKTTYFQQKTQKFVREWLEGNKSLYLNVFKFETNVRMMHTGMDLLFLERTDRNIPSA